MSSPDPISNLGVQPVEFRVLDVVYKAMDEIRKKPNILDNVLVCIGQERLDEVKKWIGELRDIPVLDEYPRKDPTYPMIIISLAGESEVEHYLGEELDDEYDAETKKYLDYKGSLWQHTVNIECYGANTTQCVMLYNIAKYIIMSKIHVFEEGEHDEDGNLVGEDEGGWREIDLRGNPTVPGNAQAPELIFNRNLVMSFKAFHAVADIFNRIESVTSIPTFTDEGDC